MSNRFISVDMDTTLDQDLIAEGLAREVVNRIQKSRKDLNFNVGDRINVCYQGSAEIEAAISKFSGHIANETLSAKIEKSGSPLPLKYDVDEYHLSLQIEKA
jgi:isoleucyl-tRNA synthetase